MRNRIKKYLYKIVTFSSDPFIWGVECINIQNGVDLNAIKPATKSINLNKMVFTHVSNNMPHHGIDRFLIAMSHYNKNQSNNTKKIEFHVIGDGVCTKSLKEKAKQLDLQQQVYFHGFLTGHRLDEVYDETDLAIGSLGIHRIGGIESLQPLKNREYTAKGLPFVISFDDPSFRDKNFVFHVSNDESVINLQEIIEWFEQQDFKVNEIRKTAEDLSWKKQMQIVINRVGE